MRIDGSWEYDEQVIDTFKLKEVFDDKMSKFNNDKCKSMTASLVYYLKKAYPYKSEDFVLIYKKANEFLNKPIK